MFQAGVSNRDFIIRALSTGNFGKNKSSIDTEEDGGEAEDDGYGVCLDERGMLSQVPDPYDVCPFNGPDPEILPCCQNAKPTVYKTITIGKDGRDIDLDIMQLSYDFIRPGYTAVFNGSRRTGKSQLMHAFARHNRPLFREVYVFTNTKASGEYFRYIPIERVYTGFQENVLLQIINRQISLRKAQTRGKLVDVNIDILVIIDDCISNNLRFKHEFNRVFWEGRHYGISLWVSSQDCKAIAPGATINADVSFIFPFGDARSTETVTDKYLYFLDKYQAEDLLDHPDVRKKHHVIAVDMAHKYNPPDRRVAVGCVNIGEEPDDFVMGCWDGYWENSTRQLKELGFGHLIQKPPEGWGILKPSQLEKWYKLGCPIIDQHQGKPLRL
jgi:hypothetical protein